MRVPLYIAVLAFVLAEIAVFIIVGEAIGVAATLALTLLAMIAGVMLLRHQGMTTLLKIRADAAAGRLPARHVAEGAVLAVAALLMILPGFLTDIVGVLLFIPALREAAWRRASRRVEIRTLRRATLRPMGNPVVELHSGEYSSKTANASPWRRTGGQS